VFISILRKFVAFYCVIFSLSALSGCISFIDVEQKVLERARQSFVKVVIENEYNAYSCYGLPGEDSIDIENDCMWVDTLYVETITGSGFSIKNTDLGSVILTAGHVCEQKNNIHVLDSPFVLTSKSYIEVIDINGIFHRGKILDIDNEKDMCSVLLHKSDIPNIKFSKINLRPGEKVYNLSAPYGIFTDNNVMVFSGHYTGDFPSGMAGFTIPAAPGSSGSPVLNKRGEVVGMIDAVITSMNQISLGPSRETLITFLNR